MASSQPDLPSDSEPKAIPESPPALPSLYDAPPSLHIFPLPPLDTYYDTYYDTPEHGITTINALGRQYGYAVLILRLKRTKKGVIKTVRLYCDRGRPIRKRPNRPPER
jgi:hypothetical protein